MSEDQLAEGLAVLYVTNPDLRGSIKELIPDPDLLSAGRTFLAKENNFTYLQVFAKEVLNTKCNIQSPRGQKIGIVTSETLGVLAGCSGTCVRTGLK